MFKQKTKKIVSLFPVKVSVIAPHWAIQQVGKLLAHFTFFSCNTPKFALKK